MPRDAKDEWCSDTTNPINWSSRRRWTILLLLTITNLVAAMTTAFEPGLDDVMRDLHAHSKSLEALTISIYTLGYCIGPIIVAPISEVYGRLWPLRVAYVMFPVTSVICASSHGLVLFAIFRAIMGFAGIIFVLLGPAIVPDVMMKEKRGLAWSIMTTGAILGPTLGSPIMGGFIIERTSWRWTLWSCAIAFGVLSPTAFFILEETYGPVLQARTRTETELDNRPVIEEPLRVRVAAIFKGPRVRPARMLIHSPIVLLFAIYTTITQGYLLLLFATLGTMFQDVYHFSPQGAGLAYLSLTVGFIIGQFVIGPYSNSYSSKMERRSGVHKPEYRLPPLNAGALIVPAGLFWYGWGSHLHWMMLIFGSAIFAVGYMSAFLPSMTYLVDTYPQHAASAIGACTVVRSICGAFLPLAAGPLYRDLGYDWGNSLLAFVALAFVPFTVILTRYGDRIRLRYPPNL
ncbi:MFS general substrate transporter [Bimuria novae-zelandiae CBS 107.79]|uniref:MFS general substrate transporter n=1 Tax=Bimuria novae-zelandiae CBS 107.79 TaxID=1447943 RepID=A0A6A5VNJ0_9PLEO|nr:MFS general substrate transporter [Bimuria novae-zelandiae CBS 107.79]